MVSSIESRCDRLGILACVWHLVADLHWPCSSVRADPADPTVRSDLGLIPVGAHSQYREGEPDQGETGMMWPSVFGPGWGWGLFVALALLSLFVSLLGFLRLVLTRWPSALPGASEPLSDQFDGDDKPL